MENRKENGFVSRSAQAEAGFPWEEIRELRREKMKEFRGAVSSVFLELLSKINREDHRQSLSSPMVTIPSMKTPATTKKFRSRVQKCWEEPENVAVALDSPCLVSLPPSATTMGPSPPAVEPRTRKPGTLLMSDQQQQLLVQEEHMKRTGSGRVLTLQELMASRQSLSSPMVTIPSMKTPATTKKFRSRVQKCWEEPENVAVAPDSPCLVSLPPSATTMGPSPPAVEPRTRKPGTLLMSDQQQQLLVQEEHMKRTGSGRVLTLQELMASSPALVKPSPAPAKPSPWPQARPSPVVLRSRHPSPCKPALRLVKPSPAPAKPSPWPLARPSPVVLRSRHPSPKPSSLAGSKRLRSVSLVNILPDAKRQSRGNNGSLDSSSGSDGEEKGPSADTPSGEWSDEIRPRRPLKDMRAFYGGSKLPPSSKVVGGDVKSFIPAKAKKPALDKEAQKAMLQEKVLKKQEEEARRKEELERKKQQEILLKKQRREERARKVAEKQAALKIENEMKKMNAVGNANVRVAQVKKKRAKEIEEKNRKLKERQVAAEARRRQDEEAQKRRLQQMEEEKQMAADLAVKRREADEEEKRLRRLEKQRQEKERQLQHEAELRAKGQELKRKLGEVGDAETAAKPVGRNRAVAQSQQDVQLHLERLLAAKHALSSSQGEEEMEEEEEIEEEEEEESQEKPKSMDEFLQGFYSALKGKPPAKGKPLPPAGTNPTSTSSGGNPIPPSFGGIPPSSGGNPTPLVLDPIPECSREPVTPSLNATFVKDTVGYAMTPVDPLIEADNYNIHDLHSEDSTDDDEFPKKEIPPWARPDQVEKTMQTQLEAINKKQIIIRNIFPPDQLLKQCQLAKIFKTKKRRFIERTSSACWSPMPS